MELHCNVHKEKVKKDNPLSTHKIILQFFDNTRLVYYTNRNKKKKILKYDLLNASLKNYVDNLKKIAMKICFINV